MLILGTMRVGERQEASDRSLPVGLGKTESTGRGAV